MTKLTGSEKQIIWATEIKRETLAALTDFRNWLAAGGLGSSEKATTTMIGRVDEFTAAYQAISNSRGIIDFRSDFWRVFGGQSYPDLMSAEEKHDCAMKMSALVREIRYGWNYFIEARDRQTENHVADTTEAVNGGI